MSKELSTEEKIDYIYDKLRKKEKLELVSWILKWGSRLLIVWALVYFFFVKLPVLKEEFIESLKPDVPEINLDGVKNSDFLNNLKWMIEEYSPSDKEKDNNTSKNSGNDIPEFY